MRFATRVVAAPGIAVAAALIAVAPAAAQTGGLESPSLWLLFASLVQIVAAAGLVVFFITRGRQRQCPRCGRRLDRGAAGCPRCGARRGDAEAPGESGR